MADGPEIVNMRDLWGISDTYLRDSVQQGSGRAYKGLRGSMIREAETPRGLEIVAHGDNLSLRAEYDEVKPGQIAALVVEVEFGPDITDEPEVYEERYIEKSGSFNRRTVPRHEFPGMAQALGELFGEL